MHSVRSNGGCKTISYILFGGVCPDVCCSILLLQTKPHSISNMSADHRTCAWYIFNRRYLSFQWKCFIISRALSVLPFPFWSETKNDHRRKSERDRQTRTRMRNSLHSHHTTDERGNKWLCYYIFFFSIIIGAERLSAHQTLIKRVDKKIICFYVVDRWELEMSVHIKWLLCLR